jgi:hypothetical protein
MHLELLFLDTSNGHAHGATLARLTIFSQMVDAVPVMSGRGQAYPKSRSTRSPEVHEVPKYTKWVVPQIFNGIA